MYVYVCSTGDDFESLVRVAPQFMNYMYNLQVVVHHR